MAKPPLDNSNETNNNNLSPSPITSPSSPSAPPSSIQCSVCGRMFGKKSIKIHEPQCVRRWEQQNEQLPPGKRQPYPSKPGVSRTSTPNSDVSDQNVRLEKSASPKRPNMFPCYLCGRLFSPNSIYIHEPQCLKKWKMENEKLPMNKRRQEPAKPDFVFTPDGKIDYDSMNEVYWKTHLNQLVPCNVCGRTFNPDRVDVHERSCKGSQ